MKELFVKGQILIKFITNFENLLAKWHTDQKMSYKDIAKETDTDLRIIMEYLSDSLTNTSDIHELLSFKEARKSFNIIKQRINCVIDEYNKTMDKYRLISKDCYKNTLEKIQKLESEQKWYHAYKSLGYFFGINEQYLDRSTVIDICNKALTLGNLAKVNFQELTKWINKGIEAYLMEEKDLAPSLEGAIYFVDAYKQNLILSNKEKGEHFINSMLDKIQTLASRKGLIRPLQEEYQNEDQDLYPLDLAS